MKEIIFDVCSNCGSHCGYTEIYDFPETTKGKRYCALCGNKKPMITLAELRTPAPVAGEQP